MIADLVIAASNWLWGPPLVLLLVGGGFFFLVVSRFLPYRHFGLALAVVAGRHDRADAPGDVSHYRALSVALASTIGIGNIAGVAVAIWMGGPGVVFWMWVTALVGMATNYFTCTLAILYRGRDDAGHVQGGPMYVIVEGLGRRWKPLAVFFCVAGMFGCLPLFTANQLAEAAHEFTGVGDGARVTVAGGLAALVALVIFGGLHRIAAVTAALVPAMVALYVVLVCGILVQHAGEVPGYLLLIVTDAFDPAHVRGDMLWGSGLAAVILLGARRAAFSNEAGIGTAPLALGAARSDEPVHDGLVAMLTHAIDTLLVCTMTALAILVTGTWLESDSNGIGLTLDAFGQAYPRFGEPLLYLCIACFGATGLFSYAYYGGKCFAFLAGARRAPLYRYLYVASIFFAALTPALAIVSFVDLTFALMAIPTMVSGVLLAPRVMAVTREYFARRPTRRARTRESPRP
jgi:alanine or glycine:cation symporter, AGCS family